MIRRPPSTVLGIFPARRIARSVLILIILGGAFIHPVMAADIAADETLRSVALYVISREILFFSAQGGSWISVRLDAGERMLQQGMDGNVAAVVTSIRAIGFSANTGKWAGIERFQPGR
ncbi:MAG: hypothetical protein ACHQ7N_13335 [Candidatus Methylomirabilales bacterium]